MSGIKDYSTTPSNNNAAPPNGFPEGMAPASLNDGMRQVMSDIRSWFENPAWIDFGDVPTQTGANTFTLATDLTARYTVGTRIRMIGTTPFTLYGTISASSYSAPNTTVTVNMDSGSLDNTMNAVAINQGLKFSQLFDDASLTVYDNSDVTKKLKLQLSGITTATTRTITVPDASGTLALTSDLAPVRGYISGFRLSTAGSSATMSISAGQVSDTTGAAYLSLAAALAKTTSAWAVGDTNGGLDTGSIANNTWYRFYAIRRPDTGVVDVIFSTNGTTPTLPSNYTQYAPLWWGRTNSSAQWIRFQQNGNRFTWYDAIADVSATNPGTSAVNRTLTVPPSSVALIRGITENTGGVSSSLCILSALNETNNTASTTNTSFGNAGSGAGSCLYQAAYLEIITDSSSQIRSRFSYSDGTVVLTIKTLGWIDYRDV